MNECRVQSPVLQQVLLAHKLLVPEDHVVGCRRLDAQNHRHVLQDAQAEGNVLPEETTVDINDDAALHLLHWDFQGTVSDICPENRLEIGRIFHLGAILLQDSLFHWDNAVQVDSWVMFQDGGLDSLDLVVQRLHDISREIVHILVE